MERDFKGIWIAKEIWLAENLSCTEKVLLAEIESFCKNGECFALNEWFGKLLNLSKSRISALISGLKFKGYIDQKIFYKEGTKLFEKRIITLKRYARKQGEGMRENSEDNSPAEFRNIINNISSSQVFEEPKIDDTKIPQKKNFNEKSEPYLLARFLERCIVENSPKFPQSEAQRQCWAKDIDLMIRKDKIEADNIGEIIDWCQEDKFWRGNILSGKKLREKYQQLRIQKESRR